MTLANRLPVEINASKSSPVVEIVWDDDHRTRYQVGELRAICPCATCREAKGESPHQGITSKPPTKATAETKSANETKLRRALPLFKAEKYQIAGLHYVGNYALGVSWLDQHQSIFPWTLLSTECPCAECRAAEAASSALPS
jgi:DUF971 family protein